jgi:hypothetical protein
MSEKYSEWITDLCAEASKINELDGSSVYKNTFKHYLPSRFGNLSNVPNTITTVYGHPMYQIGYTLSVFSLEYKKMQSNFCYIYWVNDEPNYISLSYTYISQDGEYRKGFVHFKKFLYDFETYAKEMDAYEKIALRLLSEELTVSVSVYPETEFESISNTIGNNNLIVKILAASMMSYHVDVEQNTIESHILKEYTQIYDKFVPKFSEIKLDQKAKDIAELLKLSYPSFGICGQKIAPLTVRELVQINDINFWIWREIYAMKILTELSVNFLSMAHPVFSNWSILAGTKHSMYESENIKKKFVRSRKSIAYVDKINDIIDGIKDETNKDMVHINANLANIIKYIQSFVIYSNFSLCYVSQNIGPVFYSIFDYMNNGNNNSPHLINTFKDRKLYMSMMLSYSFNIHLMHKKCGIVHTDLHLRNLTFNNTHYKYDEYVSGKLKDPKISKNFDNPVRVYIGDEFEKNTFIGKYIPFEFGIIDHSRSIFGGVCLDRIEKDFGKPYMMSFYKNQKDRMVKRFLLYIKISGLVFDIPNIKDRIALMIDENPEISFKILSYVDYILIGNNFVHYCNFILSKKSKEVFVSDEVVEYSIFFRDSIMAKFKEKITPYVNGKIDELKDIKYAGDELFEELFEELHWKHADEKTMLVLNLSNINSDLKYSTFSFDKLPKWMDPKTTSENAPGIPLEEIFTQHYKDFKLISEFNEDGEAVRKIIREVLQGENLTDVDIITSSF